jgi:hypothetical protein
MAGTNFSLTATLTQGFNHVSGYKNERKIDDENDEIATL